MALALPAIERDREREEWKGVRVSVCACVSESEYSAVQRISKEQFQLGTVGAVDDQLNRQ